MLWGLLPGSLTYDPDTGLYMMVQKWQSQPFKPKRGAQNIDYVRERARRGLRRYPDVLRRSFGDLDLDRIQLLEPDNALLTVFPRIFRCKQCHRLQSYNFSLGSGEQSSAFSRGWRCAKCGPTGRFEQISLVHTHQCGYVGQLRTRPCPVHNYAHLYIDKQGSNQPSRYRIRCMGPDGSLERPACNAKDPDLLLGGAPKNHPAGSKNAPCDGMKILAELGRDNPAAKAILAVWETRPSHIRTCQDPATARPVGLAVLNPAYAVPVKLAEDAEKVNELLSSFIRGSGAIRSDPAGAEAALSPDARRRALEQLLAVYKQNVAILPEVIRSTHGALLWTNQATMWPKDAGEFPATLEAAQAELQTARTTGGSSTIGDRLDRDDLVDDLIEISHLQDVQSGFIGLEKNLKRLRDHDRAAADQFERGKNLAASLGIEDIKISSTFDIVQMQLGYVRNISDPSIAFIRPFEETGDEDLLTFYARQTSTEAILVLLDPIQLVRWAAAHPETPTESRIAGEMTASDARQWLIRNVDHTATKAYEPIPTYPSAAVYGAVHTLAHVMMQTSSELSGIDSSGMKELIYPSLPGFVLYSAQHGGFHLGGLTSLYEDHLARWLTATLQAARDCSNDPMCRSGRMKSREHSAASCYACVEGTELACQRFNRDLDRAYLVGTVPQRRGVQFEGLWTR